MGYVHPEALTESSPLKGKKILLGVTGGIACYKAVELLRIFQRCGAEVWVVMTRMAQKFVGVETFSSLTNRKVWTELEGMDHITVPHSADLVVIAPATANVIGKIANGICDDVLTTMVIASYCPKVIVPSMNWAMWSNPAVHQNVQKLKSQGVVVIEPEEGDLACGEQGQGRFPSYEKILFACEKALYPLKLEGKKVIVTAGGTREKIDPVRFITNPSSGLTGYLVAREFALAGANVKLISAGQTWDAKNFCNVVHVESADEMFEEVSRALSEGYGDVFVATAAVADFKPKKTEKHKIKKEGKGKKIVLELERTKDILKSVSNKVRVKVGFSLETQNIVKNAKDKMKRKGLDIVIANTPENFSASRGKYIIIDKKKTENLDGSKRELAKKIVEKVAGIFSESEKTVKR